MSISVLGTKFRRSLFRSLGGAKKGVWHAPPTGIFYRKVNVPSSVEGLIHLVLCYIYIAIYISCQDKLTEKKLKSENWSDACQLFMALQCLLAI